MNTYKLNERVPIHLTRPEAAFDRACDEAYSLACMEFRIDDAGHIGAVEGAARSEVSLQVQFVSYRHYGGMGGQGHAYKFEAWIGVP